MLGFSKIEKEKAIKHKQEIQEKIKIYKEKVDKYYSLIGQEVKIGLGVNGVIDDIEKVFVSFASNYNIEQYRYFYKVRVLSIHVPKNINNIGFSSGFISGVDCTYEENHSIFERITIPCDVIIKLNKEL